jgi:ribonuclease VapC
VNGEAVVLDSSVLVAIYKAEPDSASLTDRTIAYRRKIISTATWLEAAIVCESASPGGELDFAGIVATLGIEIIPFTLRHAHLALEAFKRFGKGRGAKASLNYGDCFVYALAKDVGAPVSRVMISHKPTFNRPE